MSIPNDWVKNPKYKIIEDKKDLIKKLEKENKLTQEEKEKLQFYRLQSNNYRNDENYLKAEREIINKHFWDLNIPILKIITTIIIFTIALMFFFNIAYIK